MNDDYFDTCIDASFEHQLSESDIQQVLEIITTISRSEAATGTLLLGYSSVEINQERINLCLRFSRERKIIDKLTPEDRDELPRRMARLTWHLFAQIDRHYRVESESLPEGFRHFVDLKEP